jgi:pSer/pThr/pTyr-binding forkhead associated (FHA) protein
MPSIVMGARSYPCTATITIGRDASRTIVLRWAGGAAPYISRLHAQITVEGTAVMFRDTSEDGSYINETRISGHTVALADGDRIRIGEYELVFRAD